VLRAAKNWEMEALKGTMVDRVYISPPGLNTNLRLTYPADAPVRVKLRTYGSLV
jgi:hypothetical protein